MADLALSPAPAVAADECAMVIGGEKEALSWRIVGIFGIFFCSLIGFVLPFILRKQHRTSLFFFRTFAAGVVLAVAIVHIFPGAQEALTNPCLSFSEFPWASVIVLYAALLSFAMECYCKKVLLRSFHAKNDTNARALTALTIGADGSMMPEKPEQHGAAADAGECTECGLPLEDEGEDAKAQMVSSFRAIAFTLEAGIIFHSVFMGIALGTTHEVEGIQSLVIALLFHQGFEGIGLGATLIPCQFSTIKIAIMGGLFALTTPLGVVIGLAIYSSYNPNSKAALATEGAFNAVSAGILIYNGLVDLVVPAFDENDENTPKETFPYFCGFLSLFLGAGLMCLLALWA